MPKIAIWLSTKPDDGGIFQYTLSVMKAFSFAKKHFSSDYDILCVSHNKDCLDSLRNIQHKYPFEFFYLRRKFLHKKISHLLKSFPIGLYFLRHINMLPPFIYGELYRMGVDVVICPTQDMSAYELKIPTITAIHDLMHVYKRKFPEVGRPKEYKYREKYYRRICIFSKVIVVDSEVGKDHVLECYGDILRAKVIPLPYLPPPYILEHDSIKDYSYVRYKYDLPNTYLFYPAQFWRHKNHDGLVKSLKILKDRGVNINIVFVGYKKNNYNHVSELIEDFGLGMQIKVLGYVSNEDMIGLYKNSAALIMPTFFGPTNIPVLEAMFLGVPVLCSNIYAMPNQVGDAALLFDPENIEDMADKIFRIWTDGELRQHIIRKGKDRVKDITLENYTLKWQEIIKEATTH